MDGKVFFAEYLSSKIVTRLVLIQLIPALTVWSVFAVSIADCPIFVFSEDLRKQLPPLIDFHPLATMNEEWEDASQHLELWKQIIIAARIFVINSRLIRFVLAILSSSVSIGMVFFPQSFAFLVVILVVVLLVLGAIFGLYVVVLLHNFMFPRHEDLKFLNKRKVTEDDNYKGEVDYIQLEMDEEMRRRFHPLEVDSLTPTSPVAASTSPVSYTGTKAAKHDELLIDEWVELTNMSNSPKTNSMAHSKTSALLGSKQS